MATGLHGRLDRIEAALRAAAEGPPLIIFLNAGDDPKKIADALVAEGRITELDRKHRLMFVRFQTEAEAEAQRRQQEMLMLDTPKGDDDG